MVHLDSDQRISTAAEVKLHKFPSEVRKVQFLRETVFGDMAGMASSVIVRAVGLAVITNNWCSGNKANLDEIADLSARLGAAMMPELLSVFGQTAVAYGKAAIVGMAGELEHGAALLHPQLGAPIRHAIGGGAAVIPSNNKIGTAGSAIDIPIGHKDDAWSFAFIDTLTLSISDAPKADEIVLFIAIAAGERPFAKIGGRKDGAAINGT